MEYIVAVLVVAAGGYITYLHRRIREAAYVSHIFAMMLKEVAEGKATITLNAEGNLVARQLYETDTQQPTALH